MSYFEAPVENSGDLRYGDCWQVLQKHRIYGIDARGLPIFGVLDAGRLLLG